MIRYINVNRSTTTVTNTCVDFGAIPSDEQTQHPNQMDSSAEAAKVKKEGTNPSVIDLWSLSLNFFVVLQFSVNDPNMRIVYGNRLFFPSELFIPPKNGPLLSSRHPVKERPELRERPLASGNVFYRSVEEGRGAAAAENTWQEMMFCKIFIEIRKECRVGPG